MKNFWQSLPQPILALAPMAGVTDSAFRRMCRSFGAQVIYTEFASSSALVHESEKTFRLLKFHPSEKPVVCQIFGNNPEEMAKAAKIVEQLGFSGVDLNFGCPAYKVVKTGGGVSLMRNLPLCRAITQAVCEAVTIPVSVKIRESIRQCDSRGCKTDEKISGVDLAATIADLSVSAIMIHARSYEQPFDGIPRWEVVNEICKVFPGIVLANGGITSPEIAKNVLATTHAHGLGIARGAWGRPWIFDDMAAVLRQDPLPVRSWETIVQTMLEHATLALESKGPHGLMELRKHLGWYVRGIADAKLLRQQLVRVHSVDELRSILEPTLASH